MKRKNKLIKITSIIIFAIFLVISIVVNIKGQFLYPEYNSSLWRALLSIAYLASFCFLVYNFSHSKALFIVYTVCLAVIIFGFILLEIFTGDISNLIETIVGFVPAILAFIFVIIPMSSALYYMNINTIPAYVLVVLLFYVVYFISRIIKKHKRKDDENVKIEDG